MSELRRRMMVGAAPEPPTPVVPYVTDGLVFWLDGIDKGATLGKWTDLIGGIEFTSDDDTVIFNDNHIYCPAWKGLYYDGQIYAPASEYTIEIACEGMLAGNGYFITGYGKNTNMLGVGSYSNYGCFSTGGGANAIRFTNVQGYDHIVRLISANALGHVTNFDSFSAFNNGDAVWAQQTGISTIGRALCYGQSHEEYKKIYSIRIYNRQLTSAEMLQNQQADNVRFNLGL